MEELQQTADITELFYKGQFVEIDCQKLYVRLGINVEVLTDTQAEAAAAPEEAKQLESTAEQPSSPAQLPAYVTGRISSVNPQDFWMRLREMTPGLDDKLLANTELELALLDPNGMFKFNSRILEPAPAEHSLRITRVRKAISCRYRRFIRVAVRGRAFFISEEIQEDGNEGSLVDLGGAGVRVETTVSWLRIGDQLTILIETGFVDEKEQKHLSLDFKVPARVVWLRQVSGTESAPLYHVGFAFTEISMHDQDRLISFLLAYESLKLR